jgi:hypothetical protein
MRIYLVWVRLGAVMVVVSVRWWMLYSIVRPWAKIRTLSQDSFAIRTSGMFLRLIGV